MKAAIVFAFFCGNPGPLVGYGLPPASAFPPYWGRDASDRIMITSAVPVIPVTDSARAEDYYCRVLGFQKLSAYRPDPSKRDPCYLSIARDGVQLHLQSFKRERAGMTDAFLWASDVDSFHAEVSVRGAVIVLPPTDQSWGTRETGIRDPDGNVLVFGAKRGVGNRA